MIAAMARTGGAAPALAADTQNPFIEISTSARLAIALYFMFWRIIPLCTQLTAQVDSAIGYYLLAIVLDILTECLLVAPMLAHRFLGARIGWLHPLVLPAMVSISLGFLQNPQSLFVPLTGWFSEYTIVSHELFSGVPVEELRRAQFMDSLMTLLATASLYAGFAIFRLRPSAKPPGPVRFSAVRFFAIYIMFFLIVMAFLQMQGGIIAHMASFASGRFKFREFSGPFLIVTEFLPYMLVLWYLYRPSVLKNPVFIGTFLVACILQFIVTGSRSGLFVPMATLLAAWMMVSRKVPTVQAAVLGVTAILLVGVLGEIRRSGDNGEIDLSSLMNFDLAEAQELAKEELENRGRGTPVAVYTVVPKEVGHLWGKTYVAAIGFWVPRALWRSKPRSAGVHTAALIYAGRDSMVGYAGGGIPPGGVAEAYWNFNVPGVFLVYGLFGMFVRFISEWYARAPENAVRRILLLVAIFQFPEPSTIKIVNMLQSSTMIACLLLISRIRSAR